MSWVSEIDHSVSHELSDLGHSISNGLSTAEHDVVDAARVGETLAKGAWDYSVQHPGDIAKTVGITIGTGVLVGAAMALLPECAVVGAVVGVGGLVLGGVGLASMGVQTYDAFKASWPDLQIVWDADHHAKDEVEASERSIEEKTGGAVANALLLAPCFLIGNVAGNLGADAALAGKAAYAATAATAGTEAAAAAAISVEAPSIVTPVEASMVLSPATPLETSAAPSIVTPVETSAAASIVTPVETSAAASIVTPLKTSAAASIVTPPETSAAASIVTPPETSAAPRIATPKATSEEAAIAGVVEQSLWSFLNHNPLDDIPHPSAWMRLNNSNAFGFESNYWIEKADLDAVSSLPGRLAPIEAATERRHPSQIAQNG